MTVAQITMTMLGTTGSGKSTYLLGMYAKMSAGFAGYFVVSKDMDQDLELSDAWDLLEDRGELPPPTTEDSYKPYSFVFKQGLTPLLGIDCMDYRGGALDGKEDSALDVALLRERLRESDSIYLVLDGERVRDWIDDRTQLDRVQRKMKIRRMSGLVHEAVDRRNERGLPPPSLVLLITKADLVDDGGRRHRNFHEVAKMIHELVPVAAVDGVTALICPVQLGTFGTGDKDRVDVDDIEPLGLHRPLLFSLMHYLGEGVAGHEQERRQIEQARDHASAELATLRGGFLGGFFKQGQISAGARRSAEFDETLKRIDRENASARQRIQTLAAELRNEPILRDGVVL